MKDCCNQEIIPIKDKLEIHTNRHPNTDGTSWGWIDGCSANICWSDNKRFNHKEALKFVHDYNDRQNIKEEI